MFVRLTCPETLLCNIGLAVGARGLDVDLTALDMLREFGDDLRFDRTSADLVFADPADAVIAANALVHAHPAELVSFVASHAALEMIQDRGPAEAAHVALCSQAIVSFSRAGIVRDAQQLHAYAIPEPVATASLPHTGMVLWDVNNRCLLHVDRPHFSVGRTPGNDLRIPNGMISRRHVNFCHDHNGWRVVDLRSSCGFRLNDYRGGLQQPLHPAMVLDMSSGFPFVVISAKPLAT